MIKSKRFLSGLLFIVGLSLLTFGLYRNKIQRYRYSFNEIPAAAPTKAPQPEDPDPEVFYSPTRLVIKDLQIDLNIQESSIVDGVWQVADDEVSFLDRSAKPGEGGNIVLYGHNKWHVLGNLPDIRVGNVIEVYDDQGNTLEYEVEDTFVVSPDAVEVVEPTDHEVLTLYTCTGPLDSKRFIVKAKPISETSQKSSEEV